jgi:hypothetical protein
MARMACPGAVKLPDNRYAIPTKEPGLSKTLGKALWNFVPSLKVFFGAAKFAKVYARVIEH